MRKRKTKNKVFIIKLSISAVIIIMAFLLKNFSGDFSAKVSQAVNGNFDYKEAVSTIGKSISGEDEIIEVFNESVAEKNRKEIPKSVDNIDIEELSFNMSEQELSDDTKAEVFKIPPPSNCSYEKVGISFAYTEPLTGTVTSKYGYRDHPIINDASFHTGVDIAAKSGTAIKCFADGVVLDAGFNKTYGNYLLIEHTNGIRSFYGHNSKLKVKDGQRVKKGQTVALVGTTGMSTGPHLHFEVRNGSKRLDPLHYIEV